MAEKVIIGKRYSELKARTREILQTGEVPELFRSISLSPVRCYCGCKKTIKSYNSVYKVFPAEQGSREVILDSHLENCISKSL